MILPNKPMLPAALRAAADWQDVRRLGRLAGVGMCHVENCSSCHTSGLTVAFSARYLYISRTQSRAIRFSAQQSTRRADFPSSER